MILKMSIIQQNVYNIVVRDKVVNLHKGKIQCIKIPPPKKKERFRKIELQLKRFLKLFLKRQYS